MAGGAGGSAVNDTEETYSDTSGGIECPHCSETITDLWDYDWGTDEEIEIECSFCDEPVALRKVVSVDFYATVTP